jgi:hypothetical protein
VLLLRWRMPNETTRVSQSRERIQDGSGGVLKVQARDRAQKISRQGNVMG